MQYVQSIGAENNDCVGLSHKTTIDVRVFSNKTAGLILKNFIWMSEMFLTGD
jgi:hypothetical protein